MSAKVASLAPVAAAGRQVRPPAASDTIRPDTVINVKTSFNKERGHVMFALSG